MVTTNKHRWDWGSHNVNGNYSYSVALYSCLCMLEWHFLKFITIPYFLISVFSTFIFHTIRITLCFIVSDHKSNFVPDQLTQLTVQVNHTRHWIEWQFNPITFIFKWRQDLTFMYMVLNASIGLDCDESSNSRLNTGHRTLLHAVLFWPTVLYYCKHLNP